MLKAWLPAKEERKVRVRFTDETEIKATSVREPEGMRDKFLPRISDDSGSSGG